MTPHNILRMLHSQNLCTNHEGVNCQPFSTFRQQSNILIIFSSLFALPVDEEEKFLLHYAWCLNYATLSFEHVGCSFEGIFASYADLYGGISGPTVG